jgi:hypothetical protein
MAKKLPAHAQIVDNIERYVARGKAKADLDSQYDEKITEIALKMSTAEALLKSTKENRSAVVAIQSTPIQVPSLQSQNQLLKQRIAHILNEYAAPTIERMKKDNSQMKLELDTVKAELKNAEKQLQSSKGMFLI